MGKFIKKFSNDSARVEYEGSENYLEPYVSYVEGDNTVHYNKVETRLIARYNVEDASNPTQLYAYMNQQGMPFTVLGADMFSKVEIDGTEVAVADLDTAQGQYQLSAGEHTVKYTLIDPTFIGIEMNESQTITIPNSVTSIGEFAFHQCYGLTSVAIPDGVTSISNQIFESCSGLTSCTIGSGVTSIGNRVFYGCTNLASITSLATTAPTIQDITFFDVGTGGVLYVPSGSSGYDVWMGTGNYYLGKYGWGKIEQ